MTIALTSHAIYLDVTGKISEAVKRQTESANVTERNLDLILASGSEAQKLRYWTRSPRTPTSRCRCTACRRRVTPRRSILRDHTAATKRTGARRRWRRPPGASRQDVGRGRRGPRPARWRARAAGATRPPWPRPPGSRKRSAVTSPPPKNSCNRQSAISAHEAQPIAHSHVR